MQFLRLTGKVLCHEYAHAPELQDRVWLRPQWLVDVMRELVRHDLQEQLEAVGSADASARQIQELGQVFLEKGELDRGLLPWLWRDLRPAVGEQQLDFLLQLMAQLGLLTQVPHPEGARWLLPMRLPLHRPDISASAAHARFGAFLSRVAGVDSLAGLEDVPIASLGTALSFIYKDVVVNQVSTQAALELARDKAYDKADQLLGEGPDPHGLSRDEIGAIHIYTQEAPVYRSLNAALRQNEREAVKPYWGYIRLLQHALFKLPKDTTGTLFRGAKVTWMPLAELEAQLKQLIPSPAAQELSPEIWWAFSSTSPTLQAVKKFLGDAGERVIYAIDGGSSARDVRLYSDFQDGSVSWQCSNRSPCLCLYCLSCRCTGRLSCGWHAQRY